MTIEDDTKEVKPGCQTFVVSIVLTGFLMLGGALAGAVTGVLAAGNADGPKVAGLFVLPVALALSLGAWRFLAEGSYLLSFLVSRKSDESGRERSALGCGSVMLLLTPLPVSALGGLVVGLMRTKGNLASVVVAYIVLGLVFGTAMFVLARYGLLRHPDEFGKEVP